MAMIVPSCSRHTILHVLTVVLMITTTSCFQASYRPRLAVRPICLEPNAFHTKPRIRHDRLATTFSRILPVGDLQAASAPLQDTSYYLTRIVFLRALAFVYAVAFLVAKHQSKALIGDNGICPARDILNDAEERGKVTRARRSQWLNSTLSTRPAVIDDETSQSIGQRFRKHPIVRKWSMEVTRNPTYQHWRERLWDRQDRNGRPVTTLLWLARDRQKLNPWLEGLANGGLLMSIAVLVLGAANVPLLFGMWACQRSLMAVGGPFWGYGWEVQLAELGFHALFLVPLFSLDPFYSSCPPSALVLYTIRWHLFRVMMGAGLIKIRSRDVKWNWPNFTALYYFYETQPVPNPITRYLHWMPRWWHKLEVLVNHFVELVGPWFLLVPDPSWRRKAGLIQTFFQAVLISSGNLSFLNWLTIVPAITCYDDAFLGGLFSHSWRRMAVEAALYESRNTLRSFVAVLYLGWIGYLSVPVVKNLMSKRQVMNGSFGPLRLINTYGAFGDVNKVRYEFIVSGAASFEGPWKEYQFKVKPGNVKRRPRFISPYHYRLDWQFWIASTFQKLEYSPWIYSFLLKLLERDPDVMGLLESDPFEDDPDPPRYIRIDKYRYQFHKGNDDMADTELYWKREPSGRVFPLQGVATVESLQKLTDR